MKKANPNLTTSLYDAEMGHSSSAAKNVKNVSSHENIGLDLIQPVEFDQLEQELSARTKKGK